MPTFESVLKASEKEARRLKKEASAVKLLMLHFSDLEPTELYLKFHEEMSEISYQNFLKGLDLYLFHNKPVQYIIGYVYFYGYKFKVDEGVLIPRFETEELVANVLIQYDELFQKAHIKLVDVGTGSGCLAIALKKEEPNFEVFATDISDKALEIAKTNAEELKAEITFLQGDMLSPLKGMKFDILVSNPPYIPQNEVVEEIIHENEPHVALYGGIDGLKFYEIILSQAKDYLNYPSILAFEHGFDKKEAISNIARAFFPNAKVFTLQDMQNKDRMTFVINS
ncbi:MAG: peptide chain release factor N(5)-glutamine methyltransferase [Firmicutes bacterium]|nr:peptide chain release factor N(5)-glutamine methyltransferase [Bacillota bacterium]